MYYNFKNPPPSLSSSWNLNSSIIGGLPKFIIQDQPSAEDSIQPITISFLLQNMMVDISISHSSDYKNCCLLGCDTTHGAEDQGGGGGVVFNDDVSCSGYTVAYE